MNKRFRSYGIGGATIETSPPEQQKLGGSKWNLFAPQCLQLGASGRTKDSVGILSIRERFGRRAFRFRPASIFRIIHMLAGLISYINK